MTTRQFGRLLQRTIVPECTCFRAPSSASSEMARIRFATRAAFRPSRTATTSSQQSYKAQQAARNRSMLLYSASTIVIVGAAAYLAVPLYRVFCSTTGYGGTPLTDKSRFDPSRLIPRYWGNDASRRIRVQFNADHSDGLPWSFVPQQREVKVLPGETALAFYTAKNHSKEDIIGIATYNVTPAQVRMLALLQP